MPIGTCRLCQFPNVELRDSRFMSAGFYKIARDESRSNPNPVVAQLIGARTLIARYVDPP